LSLGRRFQSTGSFRSAGGLARLNCQLPPAELSQSRLTSHGLTAHGKKINCHRPRGTQRAH
jgi:hypothetical protein